MVAKPQNQQDKAEENPIVKMLLKRDNLFIWVTVLIAFGLLVSSVVLRGATHEKWEIKLTDITIAAIAVGLSLVITGKVRKLVVGKEGFTIETAERAIRDSADRPIESQVSLLPVEEIESAIKMGVGEIPRLLRRRIQGLSATLGRRYDGPALQQYLEQLVQHPSFRYLILLDQDDRLFGMVDARILLAKFEETGSTQAFAKFAEQLNDGDEARHKLTQLRGFVSASEAVDSQAEKRRVLVQMEKAGWTGIGCKTKQKGLQSGIVDRSKLVASMILDIANRLESSKTAALSTI